MSDKKDERIEILHKKVAQYPDFPKPGINFIDIFSILNNPEAFQLLRDLIIEHVNEITPKVEAVAALDARGFLFGPLIALHFNIPFIPIRKKGKLPGKKLSYSYKLEYGEDTLEIQDTNIKKGTKILLVDDLIATGGSLTAGCELLKNVGFDVVECFVIIEIKELNARSKINSKVYSLLEF